MSAHSKLITAVALTDTSTSRDQIYLIDDDTDMRRALEKAGKSVEFVTLREEDHWLSREATRQQMLSATVTFLEKNNPPN